MRMRFKMGNFSAFNRFCVFYGFHLPYLGHSVILRVCFFCFSDKSDGKDNCKKSRSEDESSSSKDKESSDEATSNSNNNKEKSDSDVEMQSTSCSDKSSSLEDKKEKRCRPLEDIQFLDRTINELIEVTEKNT